MMLPSDLALIQDPKFRTFVELYARDQAAFFKDFADAFGKLVSLGCPALCDPGRVTAQVRIFLSLRLLLFFAAAPTPHTLDNHLSKGL